MPAISPDTIALLSSGALLGLTCGVTPGPLFALMIGETLKRGKRAGIAVAAAPLITDLPIILVTVLVVTGLSRSGLVLGLISIAGGLFVGKLGIGTILSTLPGKTRAGRRMRKPETTLRKAEPAAGAGETAPSGEAETGIPAETAKAPGGLGNAIVANFLNPGPWIYWLTVGAPLIVGAWNRSPLLAGTYLAVFYAFLSGSMMIIVLIAAKGGERLNGAGHAWVMRALGAMLAGFAIWFLYGGALRLAASLEPDMARLFS